MDGLFRNPYNVNIARRIRAKINIKSKDSFILNLNNAIAKMLSAFRYRLHRIFLWIFLVVFIMVEFTSNHY